MAAAVLQNRSSIGTCGSITIAISDADCAPQLLLLAGERTTPEAQDLFTELITKVLKETVYDEPPETSAVMQERAKKALEEIIRTTKWAGSLWVDCIQPADDSSDASDWDAWKAFKSKASSKVLKWSSNGDSATS